MGQIEELRAFVQIVEQESIGKAAEQAGIAKSAMSRKLRLLEERMQTVLITRTTRQWALTEAGRQYYDQGLGIIHSFDEFEARVRNENLELKGEIRISVPLYFGQVSLSSLLLEFAKAHPEVRLTIEFSDRLVDVINEHCDLVVRISELQDSTLIARKLCETRHVFCASPDYIANSAAITKPQDVQAHRIIQFGSSKRPKWTFTTPKGKDIIVSLTTSMNSHDGGFLIAAAEHGHGIVRVPDFLAEKPLNAGRLVQILKDHNHKTQGIYFVYPVARHLPHRTRALMDFLRTRFENSRLSSV
ncbi:MAG: LysR family transcriptional regulator [Granulosicoccaceae bacterium]